MTRLRRAFFAQAGALAVRYEVGFDRVIDHLWQARCRHGRLPLRTIGFVEDLVTAIGCLDGTPQAWSDLREQYERPLIRQCLSRIEEADAIVFVRRYLTQLQQRCVSLADLGDGPAPVNEMSEFIADRPLRIWLGELLSDALTGGVAVHRARQTRLRWPFRHLKAGLMALVNPDEQVVTYRFPTPAFDDDEVAPLTAAQSSD